MKNYNEMANDVLRRIGEHETEQRNRRKVMKRVIMPICCFCLVALLGLSLWQGDFFNTTPPIELDDSTHIGENDWVDDKDGSGDNNDIDGDFSPNGQEAPPSDSTNSASSEGSATTDDFDKQLFYVNEIENTISGALKYLDPAKHYTETWDADKTAQHLGIYLNNIRHNGLKYKGDGTHTVTYSNDGVLVRDIMAFEYSFKDTKILVSASKLGTPYDCIYTLGSNEITNIKLGDKIFKVKFAGTVGSNAEQQPEIMDLLVADFESYGVNYRIKAENISHSDFYKIVVSVITG